MRAPVYASWGGSRESFPRLLKLQPCLPLIFFFFFFWLTVQGMTAASCTYWLHTFRWSHESFFILNTFCWDHCSAFCLLATSWKMHLRRVFQAHLHPTFADVLACKSPGSLWRFKTACSWVSLTPLKNRTRRVPVYWVSNYLSLWFSASKIFQSVSTRYCFTHAHKPS